MVDDASPMGSLNLLEPNPAVEHGLRDGGVSLTGRTRMASDREITRAFFAVSEMETGSSSIPLVQVQTHNWRSLNPVKTLDPTLSLRLA